MALDGVNLVRNDIRSVRLKIPEEWAWQPTPAFCPGELMDRGPGYSSWGPGAEWT